LALEEATGIYSGFAGDENHVAKHWKNGSSVILGDVSKNTEAYSIFLAPK
jgi:hypothetical protein